MKSILRILFISLALLSCLPGPVFAGSEPVSGIDTGIVSLDNIPGAIYFDSSKSDHYYFLKLHYGRYYDLQPGNSLIWLLEFEQRNYDKWDWSNTTIPGVSLRWARKAGIGPRAPRISSWLRYQYLNYKADGCNGPLITGGLKWSRRVSEKTIFSIAGDFDNRRSSEGSVYDLDGYSFHISADTDLSESLQLKASIGRRHGDIAVHYLDGWSPAGRRWWASDMTGVNHRVYKHRVDTDFYSVALAYFINERTSAVLSWRHDSSSSTRQDYRRDTFELALQHKF